MDPSECEFLPPNTVFIRLTEMWYGRGTILNFAIGGGVIVKSDSRGKRNINMSANISYCLLLKPQEGRMERSNSWEWHKADLGGLFIGCCKGGGENTASLGKVQNPIVVALARAITTAVNYRIGTSVSKRDKPNCLFANSHYDASFMHQLVQVMTIKGCELALYHSIS